MWHTEKMSLQAIMNQIGGVETGQMTFIGTPRLSSSQRNSHNLTLVLTSSTLRYIFRTCFSKLKKLWGANLFLAVNPCILNRTLQVLNTFMIPSYWFFCQTFYSNNSNNLGNVYENTKIYVSNIYFIFWDKTLINTI